MSSLLLFIAITSSPHSQVLRDSSRHTYLNSCNQYTNCLYRYFIDKSNPSIELQQEEEKYHDLVFRSSCPLMKNYPNSLHYGIKEPLTYLHSNDTRLRLYKIEWKISFLQWFHQNYPNIQPKYILFVEDDSFICIHHLLYQLNSLNSTSPASSTSTSTFSFSSLFSTISRSSSSLPSSSSSSSISFRTGSYNCRGGCSFDDSSTLLTYDIASAFMKFYPSNILNCSSILSLDKLPLSNVISWGRSWRNEQCNWQEQLASYHHLNVLFPDTSCRNAFQSLPFLGFIFCPNPLPLIYHTHGERGIPVELSERGLYNSRTCERFLLLDKVLVPHTP